MGLKVIFSKQLPNMPKEYICRWGASSGCVRTRVAADSRGLAAAAVPALATLPWLLARPRHLPRMHTPGCCWTGGTAAWRWCRPTAP
jgi:hypothetical protein